MRSGSKIIRPFTPVLLLVLCFAIELRAQEFDIGELEVLVYSGQLESARSLIDLQKIEDSNNPESLRHLNLKGYIYSLNSNFAESYEIHQNVFETSIGDDLLEVRAETEYYLGVLFLSISQFETSRVHLIQGLSFFSERNPGPFRNKILIRLAELELQQNNLAKAENYIALVDESYGYGTVGDYEVLLTFWIRSELAKNRKNWVEMENELRAGWDYFESGEIDLGAGLMSVGLIDLMINQPKNSIHDSLLVKATELLKGDIPTNQRIRSCHIISNYFNESGDFRSALIAMEDKVRAMERYQEEVAALNKVLTENRQQQEIGQLQTELLNQKRNNQNQNIWIILGIVVSAYLLSVVIVFRNLIREKSRTQRALADKNDQLSKQSEEVSETQNRLIKSEKMGLLGRLAAGVSHELNTPIGAIKGNIELLADIQGRELELWFRLSEIANPTILDHLMTLIKDAISNDSRPKSTKQERLLERTVQKFFEDVEIDNKEDVIDIFTDLRLENGLNKYNKIYGHQNNILLLELALYVFNRSNAIITAKEALSSAEGILHSFRTYSFKRGWEDFTEFDLSENIDSVLGLHSVSMRKVQVIKNLIPQVVISGVPDELNQVWSALIINAVEAMKGKGQLDVSMRLMPNDVIITIEDTGGGINTLEDIYDPFYTTKKGRNQRGMGLSLARKVIVKHNGSISFDNSEVGVIFKIVLPLELKEISTN